MLLRSGRSDPHFCGHSLLVISTTSRDNASLMCRGSSGKEPLPCTKQLIMSLVLINWIMAQIWFPNQLNVKKCFHQSSTSLICSWLPPQRERRGEICNTSSCPEVLYEKSPLQYHVMVLISQSLYLCKQVKRDSLQSCLIVTAHWIPVEPIII